MSDLAFLPVYSNTLDVFYDSTFHIDLLNFQTGTHLVPPPLSGLIVIWRDTQIHKMNRHTFSMYQSHWKIWRRKDFSAYQFYIEKSVIIRATMFQWIFMIKHNITKKFPFVLHFFFPAQTLSPHTDMPQHSLSSAIKIILHSTATF